MIEGKIPAKTFLVGEYAVLDPRGQALVLTHEPCFEVRVSKTKKRFHPESPAGLYQSRYSEAGTELEFVDPFQGFGGFGASTAEYLAVQEKPWSKQTFLEYRELTGGRPSGADLGAQMLDGIVLSEPGRAEFTSYDWPFQDMSLLWFRTPGKVKTYEHLNGLKDANLSALVDLSERCIESFLAHQSGPFASSLNSFTQALAEMNLQNEGASLLRDRFMKTRGVLAAKGCGALGADVFLVLCEKSAKPRIQTEIESLGFLKPFSENDLFWRT
jgi:mevalonate kinase